MRRFTSLVAVVAAGCIAPAQSFNQRGVEMFTAGQFEAARDQFQQAALADPLNADALYNLGSTMHRLGQRNEAELNYRHCLVVDPNHSKCRHALSVVMLEQGLSDDAVRLAERWLAESPGNPDALVELAWLEKQRGTSERSTSLLQQALAVAPTHARALSELASLYEGTDRLRALALYERALASDPRQPSLAAKVADLRGTVQVPSAPSDRAAADRGTSENPDAPRTARDLRYQYR